MNHYEEIAYSALSNGHITDIKMVGKLLAVLKTRLYGNIKLRVKKQIRISRNCLNYLL